MRLGDSTARMMRGARGHGATARCWDVHERCSVVGRAVVWHDVLPLARIGAGDDSHDRIPVAQIEYLVWNAGLDVDEIPCPVLYRLLESRSVFVTHAPLED